MSYGAGSLSLAARRSGSRTILERVHFDGISRCSRAFTQGEAVRIILSQLGPGVVRGDLTTIHGTLHENAHLIVTNQSATRLMGGGTRARTQSVWTLATGAVLELIGEPIVAAGNAVYDASTTIDVASGAIAVISELAHIPKNADVRLQTCVRRNDRDVSYDAYDGALAAPHAVGTFGVIGINAQAVPNLVAALDAVADASARVEIGVGALSHGAFVRILGDDLWSIRSVLIALRSAAWTELQRAQRAGGVTPAVGSSRSFAAGGSVSGVRT